MNPPLTQTVVILGASDKPERYAHKAMQALLRHGHQIILVHPNLKQIEGHPVLSDLTDIPIPIDTVTLYVGPAISTTLQNKLIALNPRRVLFNPGTENPTLAKALTSAGIAHEEACTLVLLATDRFALP